MPRCQKHECLQRIPFQRVITEVSMDDINFGFIYLNICVWTHKNNNILRRPTSQSKKNCTKTFCQMYCIQQHNVSYLDCCCKDNLVSLLNSLLGRLYTLLWADNLKMTADQLVLKCWYLDNKCIKIHEMNCNAHKMIVWINVMCSNEMSHVQKQNN